MRADEDLADRVVPDVAEDVHGLFGCASVVDGSGHDGFDHPHRFAEPADEPVGREDLRGPRPGREGVVDQGGGRDDALSRLAGQVGSRDLVRVFGDQQKLQVLFVAHMVIQGHRPDTELRGQPTNAQLVPAVPADEPTSRVQDLRPGGHRWTAGAAGRSIAWRHRPIIPPGRSLPPTGASAVDTWPVPLYFQYAYENYPTRTGQRMEER
ncbi:hypothetical protein GCM10027612_35130 [Microbispora bryophytorum subsp. camponoti]